MDDYGEYRKAYEALQTTFDPIDFDPERWARAARDAGMKYMVFTTKHHDGFSMFDTHQTDYRITSPNTPFHDEAIPHPWEVPMPMARSWSYVPDDLYKSSRQLVHTPIEVVSKGGNLLLKFGPGPDGRWHEAAYDRLEALGAWLRVNGEAIYGTRAIKPYAEGRVRLTRDKDGAVYAIYLAGEGRTELPRYLSMTEPAPADGATVTLLGTEIELEWERAGVGFVVTIPEDVEPPVAHAWAFRISAVEPRGLPNR